MHKKSVFFRRARPPHNWNAYTYKLIIYLCIKKIFTKQKIIYKNYYLPVYKKKNVLAGPGPPTTGAPPPTPSSTAPTWCSTPSRGSSTGDCCAGRKPTRKPSFHR